nr:cold shock domain-containing protein [Pseudomonas sp. Irchel 3E19]
MSNGQKGTVKWFNHEEEFGYITSQRGDDFLVLMG